MKKQAAIDHFGGKTLLARALGVMPQSITKWGDDVPDGRAWQLEVLTGGVLKAPRHETATCCSECGQRVATHPTPSLRRDRTATPLDQAASQQ